MMINHSIRRLVEGLGLAVGIVLAGAIAWDVAPALSARGRPADSSILKQGTPPPGPPYPISDGGGQVWLFWDGIFDSKPPFDTREGGSRGEGFCLIAPVEAEGALMVGDRPTFVWRGNAERLEIKHTDGTLVTQVDLSTSSNAALHTYTYEGTLEPGKMYIWRIQAAGLSFTPPLYFQVVDAETQAQIRADLAEIETEMTEQSEEAIALAKADYFAERQLWSDFWREILSVDHPSENLESAIQELTRNLCDPLPVDD